MIGKVFHPSELLPFEVICNESYSCTTHFTNTEAFSSTKIASVCPMSPSKSFIPSFWKTTSFRFITGFFVVPERCIAQTMDRWTLLSVVPEKMKIHLHAAPVPGYWGLELRGTKLAPGLGLFNTDIKWPLT